jgi:hypothetical protein
MLHEQKLLVRSIAETSIARIGQGFLKFELGEE